MPREKINGSDRDGYDVQVGWHPDRSDVQVGLDTMDGRSLLTALYGDEANLARIARAVAEVGRKPLTDADAHRFGREILDIIEDGNPHTSVWARFDRYGCNRLIRFLRRARDVAFGPDE